MNIDVKQIELSKIKSGKVKPIVYLDGDTGSITLALEREDSSPQ